MIRPLGWMGRVKSGGIGGMAVLDGEKYVRAARQRMDVVVEGACVGVSLLYFDKLFKP